MYRLVCRYHNFKHVLENNIKDIFRIILLSKNNSNSNNNNADSSNEISRNLRVNIIFGLL